ncbi:MAG: glutamine-hydrolyzing carbamoyl-phosphate synthase small subunit [Desulfohalobiaceae bacterium]|nr:glutamine-hydrolyzing carbamoyl-phosphate synthase small subunit [Desulfohalobiaceae bacterium]
MRAILGLEDGTWFEGRSFTGPGEADGEVIFNTGMSGYQEILTDPSYCRQLVCMTYPHIGNYGVNPEDVESGRVQAAGFIVKECCRQPSNFRSVSPLPEYLQENGILGLEGIDTRALTRHIRLQGAMRGVISTEEQDPARVVARAREIPSMQGLNLVDQVTCEVPYLWTENGPEPVRLEQGTSPWSGPGYKVVVYDFGAKWYILKLLKQQGLQVLVLPAGYRAKEVEKLGPDAVFLTNGPGDPAAMPDIIHQISLLIEDYPVGGICLGHQLLGLAMGGNSFKLKFGHHGLNHPVKHLDSGRIEISSQNHGFCVDVSNVDTLKQTYVNLNDNTLEGFVHKDKPIMAVQFHPEAGPGPHDSRRFFNSFYGMIQKSRDG